MTKNEAVVIVAGGKGIRLNSPIPKQFIQINGKPILFYTIEKFFGYNPDIQIIVVLPADQTDFWKKLIEQKNFKIPHKIVIGGKERFFSVKNGLQVVDAQYVAIHDGVRPFVSIDLIKKGFQLVKKFNAVIPVVKPSSSFRIIQNNQNLPIDRNILRIVQTPQFFKTELIKKAYFQTDFDKKFTDDATVYEKFFSDVYLMEGEFQNIKITTPFDLKIAEFLLQKN